MSQHQRPIIEGFNEAAALCDQPDVSCWLRRSNTMNASVEFAQLVGFTDFDGRQFPVNTNPKDMLHSQWRFWTDQQPRAQATPMDGAAYDPQKPPKYEGETFSPLVMPRLVSAFAKYLEEPGDLVTSAGRLMDWAAECPHQPGQNQPTHQAIANTLSRWLQLGADMTPLVDTLSRQDGHIGERKIPYYVTQSLGKILIKGKTGVFEAKEIAQLDDQKVVNAIGVSAQAGILEDRFWLDFGVHAAGGVARPAALPLITEKLSETGMLNGLRGAYDLQLLSRAYMTSVLKAHAQDEQRHGANTERIIKAVRPKNNPQLAVDLRSTIAVSNAIARQIGGQRSGKQDRETAAALRPADMMHVSDAFLRILHVTRRSDVPAPVQAKQFEEDVYHAEIVALLREGVVDPLRIAGHAALSRAPQAEALRQHLRSGKTLAEALKLLRPH